MKICPNCSTEFDNETLRFCTKDGTPLIVQSTDEDKFFTTLPSQASWDDETTKLSEYTEEQTQISRPNHSTSQKIVIPMQGETPLSAVANNQSQTSQPPPKKKSGAGIFAILGILLFGLLALAGIGGGAWWYLHKQNQQVGNANSNLSANSNANTPSSSIFDIFSGDSNTNTNSNVNGNANYNVNANFVTPKPTPTKTPTPKPTPTKTPSANVTANPNANASNANINISGNTNTSSTPKPTPTATPSVSSTPTPAPTPKPNVPSTVAGGMMNSRAVRLPKPAYPQAARAMNVSGSVTVAVTIDENGNVVSAKAISGHPLLRGAAEAAAKQSKFNATKVDGQPVTVNGSIVYNFVP